MLWDQIYLLQCVCHRSHEPLLKSFDGLLEGLRVLEEMLHCRGTFNSISDYECVELFNPSRVKRMLVLYRRQFCYSRSVWAEAI